MKMKQVLQFVLTLAFSLVVACATTKAPQPAVADNAASPFQGELVALKMGVQKLDERVSVLERDKASKKEVRSAFAEQGEQVQKLAASVEELNSRLSLQALRIDRIEGWRAVMAGLVEAHLYHIEGRVENMQNALYAISKYFQRATEISSCEAFGFPAGSTRLEDLFALRAGAKACLEMLRNDVAEGKVEVLGVVGFSSPLPCANAALNGQCNLQLASARAATGAKYLGVPQDLVWVMDGTRVRGSVPRDNQGFLVFFAPVRELNRLISG